MNFNLFTKLLFRIAHQWATHIDLDEYIELLTKIYQRIITKALATDSWLDDTGFRYNIYVEFPVDEKLILEQGGNLSKGAQNDDWLECRSDESSRSDYEYKYEDDSENMIVKRYKRSKISSGAGNSGPGVTNVTIKEPFVFTETIEWYHMYGGLRSYDSDESPE